MRRILKDSEILRTREKTCSYIIEGVTLPVLKQSKPNYIKCSFKRTMTLKRIVMPEFRGASAHRQNGFSCIQLYFSLCFVLFLSILSDHMKTT